MIGRNDVRATLIATLGDGTHKVERAAHERDDRWHAGTLG